MRLELLLCVFTSFGIEANFGANWSSFFIEETNYLIFELLALFSLGPPKNY